ncbi:MAG: V-type ATP synthase subunit E family protein [Anaerolineales bacterium]
MREDENIEALSRAILRDAQAEAEQIQTDAKAKVDAIRQRAQEQAESESKVILDHAHVESERLRGQVIASAQLKARTLQLEHREKILDKVFEAARQRLSSIQKRSDYDQIVAQLLREALTQLKADHAEVRADDATQKSFKTQTLEQISKELNAHISMGKSLESGIGVVVDASEGRLHYDNTLETRLNRLQNALRSSVYHVLMGEKL